MVELNFHDLEFLFAYGQEDNIREVFQRTLLKIIERALKNLNSKIDECYEDIVEITKEQDSLLIAPLTKTRLDKFIAKQTEIDLLSRIRSDVLADRRDLMSVLWVVARLSNFDGKWDETAVTAIEAVLAKHKERLGKSGVADRKEPQQVGRPATKLRALIDQMRADIASGILTPEELENIPIKKLSYRFGAHRDTAIRARQVVLREQEGSEGPISEAGAEKIRNAVIEFPTPKTVVSE